MRRRLSICLLFVVVGSITYANSLYGPFIYDDLEAIEQNHTIRQLWPPLQALSPPKQLPVSGRPIINLSLAINYQFGGLDVIGYHVVNITIHILCALVLYGIIRRTLLCEALKDRFKPSAGWLAGLCSLVWLVHPMQSECVNYIIQRTELIMALFYLLTLYAAIRAEQGRTGWVIAAVSSCALGMASKEVMVTAPVMVLLYDWSFRSHPFRQVWRRRWPLYTGLAATWLILATIMASGPRSDSIGFDQDVTGLDYALNQCVMFTKYLHTAIWPHPLVLDYGVPQPRSFTATMPHFIVVMVLAILTTACFLRRPKLGFLGVWIFIILSPTSSFVPISTEVGAERRMYLPLAAVIILVVIFIQWLIKRINSTPHTLHDDRPPPRRFAYGLSMTLSAVAIIALSSLTFQRNRDYQSEITIWKTVTQAAPQNVRGHFNLGVSLANANRHDAAIRAYREAIALNPSEVKAINNLGHALLKQGEMEEATTLFHQILSVKPDSIPANVNLARVHRRAGQLDQAVRHYQRVLEIEPRQSATIRELAQVLSATGQHGKAVAQYRRLAELHPNAGPVHYELGLMLQAHGRLGGAIESFRMAIRLAPSSAPPHNALAWLLATHPDSPHHDPRQAIESAKQAVRLAIGNPAIVDTLAVAHAAAGQYDLAITNAEKALELAIADGNTTLQTKISDRLGLFRSHKPFYMPMP